MTLKGEVLPNLTDQPAAPETKYVYDFAEGDRSQADLLGGKGAGLAEMSRLGLPVPPGFTITTEACRRYLRDGAEPPELSAQVDEHLAALEARGRAAAGAAGRSAAGVRTVRCPVLHARDDGDGSRHRPERPVRSGPRGSGRRRTVRSGLLPAADPDVRPHRARHRCALLRRRARRGEAAGPDGRREPVTRAVAGPGRRRSSRWCSTRPATTSRRSRASSCDSPSRPCSTRGTPSAPPSTADRSTSPTTWAPRSTSCPWSSATRAQTPAPASRSPATPPPGIRGLYGDYLPNAQGEDVVSGIRNALPISELERLDPTSYQDLLRNADILEKHYRDLCDIEFTIERGKLWMLQTRVGKRTPAAAFRVACQLVDEGVIDMDEALRRVSGRELGQLMFPQFVPTGDTVRLTTGDQRLPRRRRGCCGLRLGHRRAPR